MTSIWVESLGRNFDEALDLLAGYMSPYLPCATCEVRREEVRPSRARYLTFPSRGITVLV